MGGDAESLAAFWTPVPSSFRMDATMVLECKQVGIGLEAHSAMVDADSVGVFVIKE